MNERAMFRLRLLGPPAVAARDGGPVDASANQRHRLALLALLAITPGRVLSRERAMAYLWPERDTEHARQLLNQATYSLRKAIGEDVLLSSGDGLRLETNSIEVDVHEFERILDNGDPERAVALYQGPLLDAFFLSEAPEFERWVDRERQRLADRYAGALEDLATNAEAAGDFGRAAHWWKARAGHDPYDSRVAVSLMQALDASGNRIAALRHAANHTRLLQEVFGVAAPAKLTELAERLRTEPEQAGVMPVAARTGMKTDAVLDIELESDTSVTEPEPAQALRVPNPQRRWLGYAIGAMLVAAVVIGTFRVAARPHGLEGMARVPAGTAPSIAVLPLVTRGGGDPTDALLADAMTEELIAMLARTDGLRVIASTSSFLFRDGQLDVRDIADSLGVAHILEGGLQRSGGRVRVQLRLVNAEDGVTFWSGTFVREMPDVLAVQEEIAQTVASELGVRLLNHATRAQRFHTRNVAAYELYLRGTDPMLLRSSGGAWQGIEYLQHAIALDSSYAAAYAGLGRMYLRITRSVPLADGAQYFAMGEVAARKAVELDASLAEAQGTLGLMRMFAFDFASAERMLTLATALDPSDAAFREWMVTLSLWKGRPGEALAHALRAAEIDPLSPSAHAELARALLHNGRCDEALDRLDRLSGLQPALLRASVIAAECHAVRQMWGEAIASLRPVAEAGYSIVLAQLGFMHARAGQIDEALRIRQTLFESMQRGESGAFELAILHAGMDDFDQAFTWFDRSVDDRSIVAAVSNPGLIVVGPLFEELRRDPRFERLRSRLDSEFEERRL